MSQRDALAPAFTQQDAVDFYHQITKDANEAKKLLDEVDYKRNKGKVEEHMMREIKEEMKLPKSMQHLERAIAWYRMRQEVVERHQPATEADGKDGGAVKRATSVRRSGVWGRLRRAVHTSEVKE